MKLSTEYISLISALEYCIGDSCYNPNSYDGWKDEWGQSFRYPLSIPYVDDPSSEFKVRGTISSSYPLFGIEAVTSEQIMNMKYKFGSNHLFVGEALYHVLRRLEKRYDLDFQELEREYLDSINE